MNRISCAAMTLVLFSLSAIAQENGGEKKPTYQMMLTEFHLSNVPGPEVTADQIIRNFQSRDGDEVLLVESIRLTAQADLECMVQFGKRVSVVTDVIQNARGQQQVRETRELGTLVRVLLTPENDKINVKLSYAASRHEKGEDDMPPDVATTTIESTIKVKPGEQALISGQSDDRARFLLLRVR